MILSKGRHGVRAVVAATVCNGSTESREMLNVGLPCAQIFQSAVDKYDGTPLARLDVVEVSPAQHDFLHYPHLSGNSNRRCRLSQRDRELSASTASVPLFAQTVLRVRGSAGIATAPSVSRVDRDHHPLHRRIRGRAQAGIGIQNCPRPWSNANARGCRPGEHRIFSKGFP